MPEWMSDIKKRFGRIYRIIKEIINWLLVFSVYKLTNLQNIHDEWNEMKSNLQCDIGLWGEKKQKEKVSYKILNFSDLLFRKYFLKEMRKKEYLNHWGYLNKQYSKEKHCK